MAIVVQVGSKLARVAGELGQLGQTHTPIVSTDTPTTNSPGSRGCLRPRRLLIGEVARRHAVEEELRGAPGHLSLHRHDVRPSPTSLGGVEELPRRLRARARARTGARMRLGPSGRGRARARMHARRSARRVHGRKRGACLVHVVGRVSVSGNYAPGRKSWAESARACIRRSRCKCDCWADPQDLPVSKQKLCMAFNPPHHVASSICAWRWPRVCLLSFSSVGWLTDDSTRNLSVAARARGARAVRRERRWRALQRWARAGGLA